MGVVFRGRKERQTPSISYYTTLLTSSLKNRVFYKRLNDNIL